MRRSMTKPHILITCEHAGNAVPAEYAAWLRGAEAALAGHRGWDPGALEVAVVLARSTGAPLASVATTRLLVDANRSPGHPKLYSEFTRQLPRQAREALRAALHTPHWGRVEGLVGGFLAGGGTVLHVGCHSFTPVFDGVARTADIGLLYDPRREAEKTLCSAWLQAITDLEPGLRVRRNYPYRGVADGLCTALRRKYGPRYMGVELEVNQRFPLVGGERWLEVQAVLAASLSAALASRA